MGICVWGKKPKTENKSNQPLHAISRQFAYFLYFIVLQENLILLVFDCKHEVTKFTLWK